MKCAAVSALNVYPVKSCRGIALEAATLDARGIVGDRQFMLVDPHGQFLTQRVLPRLALVQPQLESTERTTVLRFAAADVAASSFEIRTHGESRKVIVWDDECQAVDQGDAVARWLSEYLDTECRLVRMANDFVRRVDPQYAPQSTDQVGFADGFPLLLISEASLTELNSRLLEPVPMNRFRPNIIVSGCAPFAEDNWRSIRIGHVTLAVVKPCLRCKVITVDQCSTVAGPEPLRTLATYRNIPGRGVTFGQNVVHDAPGTLHVGDEVEVLR